MKYSPVRGDKPDPGFEVEIVPCGTAVCVRCLNDSECLEIVMTEKHYSVYLCAPCAQATLKALQEFVPHFLVWEDDPGVAVILSKEQEAAKDRVWARLHLEAVRVSEWGRCIDFLQDYYDARKGIDHPTFVKGMARMLTVLREKIGIEKTDHSDGSKVAEPALPDPDHLLSGSATSDAERSIALYLRRIAVALEKMAGESK